MPAINEELLAKVPKKNRAWLTLPRILVYGFLVVLPASCISIMYLNKGIEACNTSFDRRIDKRVIKTTDSVNAMLYVQIKRLQMLTLKTNTYLEVLMNNEETRNVAESRWKHDSLMINNEFNR